MLGFIFGVVVGAAGYWVYRFWKGEDTSWDQSFSSGDTGASSYNSYSSQPVGGGSSPTAMGGGVSGGTMSGATSGEGTRPMPE